MADGNSIPIPQGATVGQPTPGAVPIPQGATIGQSAQSETPSTGSVLGDLAIGALKGGTEVLSGIGGGVAETAEGVKNLANKGVNLMLPPGEGVKIPDIPEEYRKERNIGEQIGGGVEQVGEFMLGNAALEGLAKATKMVELADRYPIVAKTLQLAKDHPALAKIITGAGNVAKGAAVGGAQGAVKGAAEGKTAEEAEGGAVGGAIGESATQIGAELLGAVGKRVGIGTTAEQDAMRGFQPGKRNVRFLDDFNTAAPHLQADPAFREAANVKDQVEAISDVRRNWWKNQVQPLIDQHATVPLSGIAIKNSIEKEIPDAMKVFHPERAAEIQRFANQFIPGQTNSLFQVNVGDAEKKLEYLNANLAATGFWSKLPKERQAMLETNPDVIMYKAGADAIRDELYGKLATLNPGVDMAPLKRTYGAIRNVEDELQGRVNVEGRQAPTSLKELVGLVAGVATGGMHGVAAAAIPAIDREANTARRLVSRATRKAATGEEGPISKAVTGTARGVGAAAPAAGAAIGEHTNVGGQANATEKPTRVIFQASDGSMHSIPIEQLPEARKIDPNLTVGQEF